VIGIVPHLPFIAEGVRHCCWITIWQYVRRQPPGIIDAGVDQFAIGIEPVHNVAFRVELVVGLPEGDQAIRSMHDRHEIILTGLLADKRFPIIAESGPNVVHLFPHTGAVRAVFRQQCRSLFRTIAGEMVLHIERQLVTFIRRRITFRRVSKIFTGALVAAVVVGGRQRFAVEGAEVVAGVIVTIRVVTVQGGIRFAGQPALVVVGVAARAI